MPLPNLTIDTAIDLGSLPATIAQQVFDSGAIQTVWYKFTAVRTGVAGIFAHGNLTTYRPTLVVWIDEFDTYPNSFGFAIDAAVQIPFIEGTTYFLQIAPAFGDSANPANLSLNIEWAPVAAAPAGSLAVSDDTSPYPLVLLDGATGAVLQFIVPFPSSESGEVLPVSGLMFVADSENNQAVLFSPSFGQVNAIPYVSAFGISPAISSNQVDKFYLGASPDAVNVVVKTFDVTGALLHTENLAATPKILGIAPNPAETVLYLTGKAGSLDSTISKWDLVGHAYLADFAAAIAGYRAPSDLIVLSTGHVVVVYFKQSATQDVLVKIYDSAGTVVASKSYGAGPWQPGFNPRLCHASDDPISFRLWLHNNDGTSTFKRVKVSDLSDVVSIPSVPTFEEGVNQTTPINMPTRFGHSQSCPFWELRQPVASGCIPPLVTSVT